MIYCTVVIPQLSHEKSPPSSEPFCRFILGMLRHSAFCKADVQPVMTPVGLKRGKATI